ncbi:MAG: VCBS repeat-containing protein [Pirellulaceae bacterium]|nr:VCBS repeat-containing protein [Planctomycetales bacterium]
MDTSGYRKRTTSPAAVAGALSCLLVVCGCTGNDTSQEGSGSAAAGDVPDQLLQLEPLAARRADGGSATLFVSVPPERSGVDFAPQLPELLPNIKEIMMSPVYGGICTGDYDGDGRADFYVGSPAGEHRLYRNVGDFRFEDVTVAVGLADDKFWGTGCTFVDVDNDGDLDIYACAYEDHNRLYINEPNDGGDGRKFSERAAEWGVDFQGASMSMAFADVDGDGDLDGYLATTAKEPPPGVKLSMKFEGNKPIVPPHLREYWQLFYMPGERAKLAEAGQYDHFYRNDGERFTDVSQQMGLDQPCFTLAATWWDYDDDNRPDLYAANDFFGPDLLFHNDGNGAFTESLANVVPHTPWFSMGCDSGDINNDGLLDFIATDMLATTHQRRMVMAGNVEDDWFFDYAVPRQYMRNSLFINSGKGRMWEAAYLSGIAGTDWTWTPRLADFDNDGRLDLFITNGVVRDSMNADVSKELAGRLAGGSPEWAAYWVKQPLRTEKNLAFRNDGDLAFTRVDREWGLGYEGVTFGAATADFDNDGDTDLITFNFDAPIALYRNQQTAAHGVNVRLIGTISNRYGLGAKVTLRAGGMTQTRYVTMSRGWQSSVDPVQHFGLGEQSQIELLVVRWPSGTVQQFEHLAADQLVTITEPTSASSSTVDVTQDSAPWLTAVDHLPQLECSEEAFDDFAQQRLLPYRLSESGPALAQGDVDGDGDEDLYYGGTRNIEGKLLLNVQGELRSKSVPAFEQHSASEDVAAVFLDADNDDDLDLYVVSGSIEDPSGHRNYTDRLYLNDGTGKFSFAPDALPDIRDSGSCVVAADWDLDGDLDLFVGARCVPGEFPTSPKCRLLVNEEGRFTDQTPWIMTSIGMVTCASAADIDGDHRVDLVVGIDWGPVKVFLNKPDHWVESSDSGLSDSPGLWRSLAAADIDNDGDIDLIAGNWGLNGSYAASVDHPLRLYYGDIERTGKLVLLEAESDDGQIVPRRQLHRLADVVPAIRAHIATYAQYGQSSVTDIFEPDQFSQFKELAVVTLESLVLINDGLGYFRSAALPRLAQIAPCQGIAITDIDGDQQLDAVLSQNFFGMPGEIGRMDGGLGLVLKGDGQGHFEAVGPRESGLMMPVNGRAVLAVDLNADGRNDLIFAPSGAPPAAFLVRPSSER